MQQLIYITVDTLAELADLEMDANFICRVAEDGGVYRGDPEGGAPINILDEKKPVLYSRIYLYE